MPISDIKGSVTVQGREGSIEVVGFSHGLNLPVDKRITWHYTDGNIKFTDEWDERS
ncbi:type VI secretion system tube protein Hcp [Burkholderia sp. 3C]